MTSSTRSTGTRHTGAWLRAVGELVLPRACAGCRVESTWWCEVCAATLARRDVHRVELRPGFACHVAASYRGPAGRALVAMKDRSVAALVDPLAVVLARSVAGALNEVDGRNEAGDMNELSLGRLAPVVLVPAPSRPAAVRARGSDVLAVLARATARRSSRAFAGREVRVVRALVHTRAVVDQTGLDMSARADNLDGALRLRPLARPLLAGRTVVLVDDVVTTGSTLLEMRRAVERAVPGARTVAAAVATAHRSGDSLVPGPGDG